MADVSVTQHMVEIEKMMGDRYKEYWKHQAAMPVQSIGVGYPTAIGGGHWKQKKRQLLMLRLDIPEHEVIPFEFLDFMEGTECVFVMVAKTRADKPVIIEDEAGLFPSDTLITQLRLMLG